MVGENEPKHKFNIWEIVQAAGAAILVSSLIAFSILVLGLRDSARDSINLMGQQAIQISDLKRENEERADALNLSITKLSAKFYQFEIAGARYSKADGKHHSDESKRRDADLAARIEKVEEKNYTQVEAEGDRELMMHTLENDRAIAQKIEENIVAKIKNVEANIVRLRAAIRGHLSIPEHEGAKYRLRMLEERSGGLEVLRNSGVIRESR